MAEALALAGVRWVMSPIIGKVLSEGFSHLGIHISDKIENLETTIFPQFELLIEAAEKSPHRNKLKLWLKKVKVALYDAEDVLDEYEYHLMESKVRSDWPLMVRLSSLPVLSSLKYAAHKLSDTLSILSRKNIKLRNRLNKLEKIAADANTFRKLLAVETTNTEETPIMSTTSLVKAKVFGRDKERDHLISLLLGQQESHGISTGNCFSVHAIVGLGGVGKTTLAQYVYNDPKIADCFDVRVWVSLCRHFDMFSLTRQMIEAASRKKCSRLENLDTLQCTLKDLLEFNRFLIVLDDVWFDEWMTEEHLEQLLAPLRAGKVGSKILLTTRTEKAAEHFGAHAGDIMSLKELGVDDMLSLIMHHAFHDVQRDIAPHEKENLVEIGKQIAEKLKGSPLAAKAMGNQLRKNLDIRVWTRILKENMSSETEVLVWSYKRLPAELQRCFSYCSIFPRGHRFERKKLVLLWMAEGFINLPKGSGRMEDTGDKYFNELLFISFFNQVEDGDNNTYLMHDLLHDLAERVSKDDCFRLDFNDLKDIPPTVRHLSVRANRLSRHKDDIYKLKKLRTLIFIDGSIADMNNFFEDLFRNLKKLRVLSLSHCGVEILPENIGHLRHLRYLDISANPVSVLPESFCMLYHLQSLNLNGCKVESLPKGLNSLFGLRHLDGEGKLVSTIPEMGKLTSLQGLKEFRVKQEKGYELGQLKTMRELRGMLHIANLELVESYAKATEAELDNKDNLDGLWLEWDWEAPHCVPTMFGREYEVMEGLRPRDSLTELRIESYFFPILPNWMMQRSCLPNLTSLDLSNCRQIQILPQIDQVFPHLTTLVLTNLMMLKRLSSFPPTLTKVVIKECPLLGFLFKEELEIGDQGSRVIMEGFGIPQVKSVLENAKSIGFEIRLLVRSNCAVLSQLMYLEEIPIPEFFKVMGPILRTRESAADAGVDYPDAWHRCLQQQFDLVSGMNSDEVQLLLPQSLEQLDIKSCIFSDRALSVCLLRLRCLTRLSLNDIYLLTSLPSEEVLSHLTNLESLDVKACWFLTSLGGIGALLSLKDLTIHLCPSVGGTALLPPKLQSLMISKCRYPEDLLAGSQPQTQPSLISSLSVIECRCTVSLPLGHLTSLQKLSILRCENLSSLQGLGALQSLKTLSIGNCPSLALASRTQSRREEDALLLSKLDTVTVDDPLLLEQLFSRQALAFLAELEINSSNVTCFTYLQQMAFQHLISLKQLSFLNCRLLSLPANLNLLTVLVTLRVKGCSNILSLPELPQSLRMLWIEECSPTLKDRCQEGRGADWPKVASIPHKVIR